MFAAFQGAMNESSLLCLVNVREIGFKLLADAREVGVDRVRLDIVAHVGGVEAESIWCGLYRHVMKVDKGQVGVQGRTIVVPGADINGLSQHDCLFFDQLLS